MKALYNIPEICFKLGVTNVVLSPGSRNAPLSLGFSRHSQIQTHIIPDERSAGYIALGIAQSTRKPVVVCCTSGTAVVNLSPAVTEAFYQKIPLIILTADRPPELIDQGDGQSVRQTNIFHNHIKKSYQLLSDYETKESKRYAERSISEAIILSEDAAKGPVHVNIPLREPFYPSSTEETKPETKVKTIRTYEVAQTLTSNSWITINNEAKRYDRILVLVGQNYGSVKLTEDLNLPLIPVVAECTANIFSEENIIKYHDIFLNNENQVNFQALKPDLLITIGEHFISKNLKQFIRQNPPQQHWHVGTSKEVADVFSCLTKIVPVEPEYFFKNLSYEAFSSKFLADWLYQNNISKIYVNHFLSNHDFGEFKAIKLLLSEIPNQAKLHFANSMPVRYGNVLPIHESKKVQTFANRGTSGIDGSISTAVGHALAHPEFFNVIITGDLSFFYDRNALWHNYDLKNLRIILLNNHGGGIFKMIPGPKKQPEVEELFVTNQKLNAKNAANDFGFEYCLVRTEKELNSHISSFFAPSDKPKLLEVESSTDLNTKVYDQFRSLKDYGKQD